MDFRARRADQPSRCLATTARATRAASIAVLALGLLGAGEAAAAVTTLCVNPGGTGGCLPSIQQAVDAASGATVIEVAAGTYAESVDVPQGKILTIVGAGAGQTVIANGFAGGIAVRRARLAISGVTFDDGQLGAESGARVLADGVTAVGGAVLRAGTRGSLTVRNSTVEEDGGGIGGLGGSRVTLSNVAALGTGGVAIGGGGGAVLDMRDCRVENSAQGAGTGVRLLVGSRATIRRSLIANNAGAGIEVGEDGRLRVIDSVVRDNGNAIVTSYGGISAFGAKSVRIEGSTISGNQGFFHGGVRTSGNAVIKTSTISGNVATDGAGVVASDGSRTQISNTTIAGNVASDEGGGLRCFGACIVSASIVADNQAGTSSPDCSGTILSKGFNLIEDPSGCTITAGSFADLPSADPMLDPLANNGGPTPTQALQPGSPAIGVVTRFCGPRDQRGVKRKAPCDAGAYEAP